MEVVVIGTGPEGEDVLERPREIVSAVSVNGLEETEDDPGVHSEVVKVSGAKGVDKIIGPVIVPAPRMKTSAGWAYSAVNPKGAEYL